MFFAGSGSSVEPPPSASLALVVLHEHQVPVLQEALVLPARQIVRLAVLHTAVDVQLRARPARTVRPGLPEVLRARAAHDPLARNAQLQPVLDRLLVGAQAQAVVAFEHRHPDVLLGEAEHLARELPRERDRLALEVVAEREVAQHLEERQVARGVAHVVDVHRPEHLLTARQPRRRRGLLAEEVRLQRVHPRDRQERRGVVRVRHQRRRRDAPVAALLEEAQVALADLVRGHGHGRDGY